MNVLKIITRESEGKTLNSINSVVPFSLGKSVLKNLHALGLLLLSIMTVVPFSAYSAINISTTGQQNTLVLMVNFQENPDEEPLTLAEADDLVFGQVDTFYRENSFGQTWLSGQVAGWFTLPLSNQVCDFTSVKEAADQMALDAGVPLNSYERIVYLMTKTACGVSGSATMDGVPSRAYINGSLTARTIAHELGHNFGLYHSSALDCGDKTLSEQCSTLEYGDTYDVMGSPDIAYFNTFQKERLGWLSNEYADKTLEVSQDGLYTITHYETQTDQPVTLKIPRGQDPDTGTMRWFYIEYRQSVGFDDFLDSRSYSFYRGDVTDGIVIRTATDGNGRSSHLLHFKTDSQYHSLTGTNDWLDPAMPVGDSFTDPDSGVTFSLVSAANGMAEVSVSFGDSGQGNVPIESCSSSAPQISATAMADNSVAAGQQVQYLVTVTNQNSAECENATFNVSAVVPSGWQASSEQMNLAPETSGQVVILVVSSDSATADDYDLTISAEHGSDSQLMASTNVVYRVVADSSNDYQAPEAVDDNVTVSNSDSVVIDVLANDVIEDSSAASVVSLTQPNKGSVQLLADGTLRYTPHKSFKSSDSFSYTISNDGGQSTALVSIVLQSSSDSDTSSGKGKSGKGHNK